MIFYLRDELIEAFVHTFLKYAAPGTACGVPGTLEQRGWGSPAKVLPKSYQVLHALQVLSLRSYPNGTKHAKCLEMLEESLTKVLSGGVPHPPPLGASGG